MPRYPEIHPKLICCSSKSCLFKGCLAPLTKALRTCYWDTCINSLNINQLLFTFVVSFITVETKQHVVCAYVCVCVKVQTIPQEMKKAFSFTKQVKARQRFIEDGIGYLGNRFEFFHQTTRCSVLTYFQLLYGFKVELYMESLQKKVFLSTLNIYLLLKCITLFPLHF